MMEAIPAHGTGPRADSARRRAFLLVALATFALACPRPGLPPVPPPPEPFERYPYVQAVTDSSAVIMWLTRRATRDTLLYEAGEAGLTIRLVDSVAVRRHRVTLRSLPPNAAIRYRVASGSRRTETHTFRTAPTRGVSDTFSVLIWGDSGYGSEAQVDLAGEMFKRRFDLALHTGDIAYNNGSDFAFTHRHFRVYRPLLARTPFFPALGNHDLRTDGGAPADSAFVTPNGIGDGRRYYSFDWGRAHFVALATNEEDGSLQEIADRGEQYQWLECDLAAASADPRTDWLVVYMHRPVYSTATGFSGHGSDEDLRDALVPLFDRYGVDLVFAGHDHFYERSSPLRNGEIVNGVHGTTYIVSGGGGATQDWRGVDRDWHTAHAVLVYHFVSLRVEPSRLLGEIIGRDGPLIDSFMIRKSPETPAGPDGVSEEGRRSVAGCAARESR